MSLQSLREAAGLTQKELGEQLAKALKAKTDPKSYQTRISSYETGRVEMPATVAVALVKVLNKRLDPPSATVEAVIALPRKRKKARG